jgi:hypothetical protein
VTRIVSIVEGDGEVKALPVLLRRLHPWLAPEAVVELANPIRVRKDRFLNKEDEFSRMVTLARNMAGEAGACLILLDADDDCPKALAGDIQARARQILGSRKLAVVIANREYEAWFIAGATSIAAHRKVSLAGVQLPPAESRRDAKGWVRAHLCHGLYGEITDQAKMTATMDLDAAHAGSRSFRKLCTAFKSIVRGE